MGKYESPRSELWSSLDSICEQFAQGSSSSSYDGGLAKEISDAGHLSNQQEAKAAQDFNERLAQKRRGRNN
jgi:hypothetical protein